MFKKTIITLLLIIATTLLVFTQTWRSALYPTGWYPGYKDSEGRFLHDFSYAGYHSGEKEIPLIEHNIVWVTNAPFLADSTGETDATPAIQMAIDSVGKMGGGVVFLPKGTYRIQTGTNYALYIKYSNVVLRGEGINKTFIFNNNANIRQKHIILIKPEKGGDWSSPEGTSEKLTFDIENQDSTVVVSNTTKYKIGDRVVLTTSATEAFIAEHKMTGLWNTSMPGVAFYRQIKKIIQETNTLVLDSPVRYYLKTRDNARIYKVNTCIEEVGLEHFSIASRQSTKSGMADLDYKTEGTGAYEVHASQVISFIYTVNSWMRNVSTYKPLENTGNYHIASNGVLLEKSRQISIDSCYWAHPQYEGEGGNGYHFTLRSNDCLIMNSTGDNGRHNFDFKSMYTSGNVILRCTGKNPRFASDYHMHLSMANLIDNFTVDGDLLEAAYRPYGTILHGHTTTQSVFWNTTGKKAQGTNTYIIKSQQWGWGYVIGTKGNVTGVLTPGGNNTQPVDFTEGKGKGESLEPQSLYDDQLRLRLNGYDPPYVKINKTASANKIINLYPNPAGLQLNIKAISPIKRIEVYNITGNKLVDLNHLQINQASIDISKLNNGNYLLKTTLSDNTAGSTFFMKN